MGTFSQIVQDHPVNASHLLSSDRWHRIAMLNFRQGRVFNTFEKGSEGKWCYVLEWSGGHYSGMLRATMLNVSGEIGSLYLLVQQLVHSCAVVVLELLVVMLKTTFSREPAGFYGRIVSSSHR